MTDATTLAQCGACGKYRSLVNDYNLDAELRGRCCKDCLLSVRLAEYDECVQDAIADRLEDLGDLKTAFEEELTEVLERVDRLAEQLDKVEEERAGLQAELHDDEPQMCEEQPELTQFQSWEDYGESQREQAQADAFEQLLKDARLRSPSAYYPDSNWRYESFPPLLFPPMRLRMQVYSKDLLDQARELQGKAS